MKLKGIVSILFIALLWNTGFAQAPSKPTSAEIYDDLLRLNVLGSVLYVAAHPDDENTRMISYFSNEKRYRTTYLSLTRGDGGQNLIGPEIRELLGVIRTQELLAARRLDGGHQWFSRANDFGYSKSSEETMKIWNEEAVKADAIWAIRKLQPDIVINRFNHDTSRRTHGHHTASAVISYEVFDQAGKSTVHPEQLKYVKPWQPQRLFLNTSWWFYGSREKFAEVDKSDMVAVDAGVFYPLHGKSNIEIAAESRSMHQCQGMGNTGRRGKEKEYLQIIKGDLPKNSSDPMVGINTTWTRLTGGAKIGQKVEEIIANFKFENPANSLDGLLTVYGMIDQLPDGNWKRIKKAECLTLIKACSGLFVEAVAEMPSVTPGNMVTVNTEVIQRIGSPFKFKGLELVGAEAKIEADKLLNVNEGEKGEFEFSVPTDYAYSTPYWLNDEATLGMYDVPDQDMRGVPENDPAFKVIYHFEANGKSFDLESPLVYKKNDAVVGETYAPFVVTPPFSVAIQEKVAIFSTNRSKPIQVKAKCLGAVKTGTVRLKAPAGWRVEPANQVVNFSQTGEEQKVEFEVFPPEKQTVSELEAIVDYETGSIDEEVVVIDYNHIPKQTVLQPARAKAVKIDVQTRGTQLGYIMGAGDDIPANLEQIGYSVTLLDPANISAGSLKKYDAVILGIRAFNTKPALKYSRNALMQYVKEGGNLIVQYNTRHRLVTKDIAPYPVTLSRDRVSVEEAEIRFLAPDHEVLNSPNKITQEDFKGWVQERGLYFASEWDEAFTPILSSNDPGEDPKDGGLLVAKYGAGNYVITGYSWFRELPAGVPGAYRIFANLISLGKESRP